MEQKKQMICINCPMGCEMTVTLKDGKFESVHGNTCLRGEEYAVSETQNPVRTVTTVVKVYRGDLPFLSVKTQKPVPKNKIFEIMKQLKKVSVQAPIKIGDIILENASGTGINVVATNNIKKIG